MNSSAIILHCVSTILKNEIVRCLQRYLLGMIEVAKNFPDTKFLAYTKRNDIDFSIGLPPNLRIRFSMWEGWDNQTSLTSLAWIADDVRCPENTFTCPSDCRTCSFCWDSAAGVKFHKH